MKIDEIKKELNFKAIRSSGSGGQHVNKVSSKIELSFDIVNSKALTENEKKLLIKNLSSRLTKSGVLILFDDRSRSQHKNKKVVIERFFQILKESLSVPKKRKPTKINKIAVYRRLEKKKKQALKKALRRKPNVD